MLKMLKRLHTVRVPHRKHTKEAAPIFLPLPDRVTIPMSMHIGAPATPTVKVGDKVKVGDVIAEPSAFVSSYIHASISGKVTKVGTVMLSNGAFGNAVTIESDGKGEISDSVTPPTVESYADFIEAVKKSGAVGLGGAGFPTVVKLSPKDLSLLDTVIINAAECEPYITSDTRTMLDSSEDILAGVRLLRKHLGVKSVILAIEENKPAAIKKMRDTLGGEATVMVLPSRYPQGAEKLVIFNTVGRVLPEGKLPIDVGVIVINCTTLAFLASYIRTGMPLVRKTVTVDGGAVKRPQNLIVPIGTPLSSVFDACGGFKEEPDRILYGGPMMGITVPSLDTPVLKNTNALLALTVSEAATAEPSPCLRCGACVSACPMGLTPPAFSEAFRKNDCEMLGKLKIQLCMECGCCSFVCPAHRKIVQTNRLAKRAYTAYLKERKAK